MEQQGTLRTQSGLGQHLRGHHAGLETVEDPSLVQIRKVDGMPGPPELVGEVADTGGQSVRVVEQQHFSHSRL